MAGLTYSHHGLPETASAPFGIPLPPAISGAAAKRRADYVAGRLAAAQALQGLTGTRQIPGRDSAGVPVWPRDVVGSISHSHGRAMAVVARSCHYQALGLDMERRLGPDEAERVAKRVLTDHERTRLAGLPADQAALLVTLTFSFKESLFKALYPLVGQKFYFPDAEVLSWDVEAGTARLQLCKELSPEWLPGRTLTATYHQWDNRVVTLLPVPCLADARAVANRR